jgi:glycosyltransferase involved in cell wall biosynthesis
MDPKTRKRFVAVVTRGDEVGGAQIHVRDICAEMLRKGHEVAVIVGSLGAFSDILKAEGVKVVQCNNLRRSIRLLADSHAYAELRHLLRRARPDLVILHSSKAGILGRIASHSLDVPCVFTAHGWAFTEGVAPLKRWLYAVIERAMVPLVSKIINVSKYDQNLALKAGMPAHKVVQIYNGITPDDALGAEHRGDSRCVRAIMVARFGAQKDHITLLQALNAVPTLDLDFIGEGPTLAASRAEATALGLNGRVRFLGYREDTAQCLRAADIFCLISNYEGFPYTTLEAMREGLPTLVSDVGGAGEAVVEGQTGFLIPKGNVDVLAQRLALLASNAELRRRMGAAAREHFLANFTFDRMFNRTLQVYEEVLAGRK